MNVILSLLLLIHGLLHGLGTAQAFGWAEVPALSQPISRGAGLGWTAAGLALIATGALVLMASRSWWMLGLPAAALSQVMIFTAWSDARAGTLLNLVIAAAGVYAFASEGPWSFRAAYRDAVEERTARASDPRLVNEVDLQALPAPVAGYLRAAGAVGRACPAGFRMKLVGRIRGGPDQPWMPFTSEQYNAFTEPARFFLMRARKSGLPVDVFHRYEDGHASMGARVLSVFPIVDARGPEMDRSETVTLFNDMALFAPAAMITAEIRWEAVDEQAARGHFTVGEHTISALLRFGVDGLLADFVSDDRGKASADGRRFTPARWSTPVTEYLEGEHGPVPAHGIGLWHEPEGPFAYFDAEIHELKLEPHA